MPVKPPAKILIVDDEPLIAKILTLHLEEAGYPTDWAPDGETCLSMLAGGGYSLVLIDIWMPHMSGVQVLEQIRESGSDVAVIMMSGHGSENLAVNCMKIGALDYFSKPFELNDVQQRVEQALINRATLLEKQRLEREKDDFVSMLSHDMKNPITAVIGSIDIMREGRLGPVNQEQADYLHSAIDSCNEVVVMIDNLLDIHRFEAGRMHLNIQAYDAKELISAVYDKFFPVAEREGVKLTLELGDELLQLAVDRTAFNRIMSNLLGNALKFTPEGGSIAFSGSLLSTDSAQQLSIPDHARRQAENLFNTHRQFVWLSVRDTGNGIPEEDQESIFVRFVQSRRSNREYGGVGLGLAYCKLMVKRFNGVIWVNSTLGHGSEFIILLPCLEIQEEP